MRSRIRVASACAFVGSMLIGAMTFAQQPPPGPDAGGGHDGPPPPPRPEQLHDRGGPAERRDPPDGPAGRGGPPSRGGPGGLGEHGPFGGPGGREDAPVRQFEVMRRYLDVVERYSR